MSTTPDRRPLWTGALLCGGGSRRMGLDKLVLEAKGKPLHEIPAEALRESCGQQFQVGRDLGLDSFSCIPDLLPGEGPLVALFSALEQAETPWLFALAGDMPSVDSSLLVWIQEIAEGGEHLAVVPLVASQMEPLCAAYSSLLLPFMRASVNQGERSIQSFLLTVKEEINLQPVPAKLESQFLNLNRPQDWERFTGTPLQPK